MLCINKNTDSVCVDSIIFIKKSLDGFDGIELPKNTMLKKISFIKIDR